MASANTKNLFGEDTDSSDESVDVTETAATDAEPGEGGDDDGDDAKGKEKDGDENDSAQGGDAKEADGGTPDKSNNALFGDDDDSSSEDDEFDGNDGIVGRVGGDKSKAPQVGKSLSMNQKLGLDSDSDNEGDGTKSGGEAKEEEAPKKYVPPRRMELLDLDPDDNGSGSQAKSNVEYHITKLPNLVGINSAPYNAATHDVDKEEEHYRGYIHNMIRWRYKPDPAGGDGDYLRDGDGNLVRESNTRLVKWSDGSYTLHVGPEALAVDAVDSSYPEDHADPSLAGFAGINGYLYASKTAQTRPPKEGAAKDSAEGAAEEDDDDDDEDGPPPKPAGTVLECLGPIASRLVPRPSSLTGDAHRNLALSVRQRSQKRARIAEFVTEVDPEKEKLERIKGKDDLARSRDRKSGGRRGGGGRRRMSASYLEEEEEGAYDGVNLGRVKRHTMRRDRYDDEDDTAMDDYGDDASGEEEDEWTKKKGRKRGAAAARAKSRREEEEDESSEEGEVVFGDDDDDDDEEDVAFVGKKRGGGAKKAVLDDDDDD